jgi:hypothetical protein
MSLKELQGPFPGELERKKYEKAGEVKAVSLGKIRG